MPDPDLKSKSAPLSRLNDGLTAFSAVVTTLGAVAAGIAAIMSNFARDEAADAKGQATQAKEAVMSLEERERNIAANYRFAEMFLKNLQQSSEFGAPDKDEEPEKATARPGEAEADRVEKTPRRAGNNDRRNIRAVLAALDIVAKSTVDETGDTPAAQKAVLPIYVALMVGDAGAVAALDDELRHLDRWKTVAAVDDRDATRLTAIRALEGIAKRALRDRDLDRLHTATDAMLELTELVSTDSDLETNKLRIAACTAQARVFEMLAKDLESYDRLESESAPTKSKDVRNAVHDRMAGSVARVESAIDSLLRGSNESGAEGTFLNLELLEDDAKQVVENARNIIARLRDKAVIAVISTSGAEEKAVAQVTAGRAELAQSTAGRAAAVQATALPGTPGFALIPMASAANAAVNEQKSFQLPVSVEQLSEKQRTSGAIQDLLQKLESETTDIRRGAREQLAVLGQQAIPEIIAQIKSIADIGRARTDAEDRRIMGLAVALSKMRQPVRLTEAEAQTVIKLLDSNNAETRVATVTFLVKLEDQATIHAVYKEISAYFAGIETFDPDKDGRKVMNLAAVVAGWMTSLSEDVLEPGGTRTMKAKAKEEVWRWREILLARNDKERWYRTIQRVGDMVKRADSYVPKKPPTPTPPAEPPATPEATLPATSQPTPPATVPAARPNRSQPTRRPQ